MQIFLIIADLVFLIAGVLFLFFPKAMVTLSKFVNEVLVYTDEKIYAMRKLAGVACFVLVIFLTLAIARLYHWIR